jgi:2-oxoglutarate ferredoxin oxidoreductase subunit alpha
MERLARKHLTARTLVPAPRIEEEDGAQVGLIAYGSTHWALIEARDQLRARGIPTGYMLVRALPFTQHVAKFVARHQRVYVVEQNRDGQMAELMRAELPDHATKIRSVRHFTGLPIPAGFVTTEILAQESETAGKGSTKRMPEGVTR